MPKENRFNELVYIKFILYKSLFSNLPYEDIREIATYLPVFSGFCEEGLQSGMAPAKIVEDFFEEYKSSFAKKQRENLLFKFIQFIERQVVLFDALEDAAFEEFHDPSGSGTLTELFAMAASHKQEKELAKELSGFQLRPVLTAHPTQFYTSQVLAIITDLTELFKVNDIYRINRLLLQLSKTPFFKKDKPTPYQEAERLTWYLTNIFYDSIPEVQSKISEYVQSQGMPADHLNTVQLGFWPGGDRDGNPYVTHQTTLQTAALLKSSVLRCYLNDVKALRRQLTFKKVDEQIDLVYEKLYSAIYGLTIEQEYTQPEELIADLENIRKILIAEHESIYMKEVEALIQKVRLFGWHFVSMDIRQNSSAHETAVLELLEGVGTRNQYAKSGEVERMNLLMATHLEEQLNISETTREVLDTIRCIRDMQEQYGATSVHRYIISNCSDISDMAEVLFLFHTAGWKSPVTVDIVPLFETVDDLRKAGRTMKQLYAEKNYKAHLKSRGNKQTVMLGFSDGTKDGGYLMANWGIYKAKQAITKVSRDAGIQVVFFDGRGGPAARGGGKAHLFYASMDKSIAVDEVQLTIQGQTISANYGIAPAAISNMEQLLHGGIAGKLFFADQNKLGRKQLSLLEELADYSYQEYVKLKNNKRFLSYLEDFSPIKYLGSANIASRPASRKGGKLRYEDLRAITFVGAWYQIKQNVPGFYGMGAALKKIDQAGRLDEVKELYKSSLFFKALIDNSMMALTKTNFSLTKYIKDDKEYGSLWRKIHHEYQTCVKLINKISGMKTLMENEPAGYQSITIREDLVVPLAVIQQYALNKLSNPKISEQEKRLLEKMIVRTLYGMTNAGRNSV